MEKFKKIAGKILKYFVWFIIASVSLTVAILIIFKIVSAFRENTIYYDAAPTSGRFTETAGLKMYIQEAGNKENPPVVLIHGFGAWSGTWQKTMEYLSAQGFYVVALDIPPFGFSERPTDGSFTRSDQAKRIIGVIDSLGLKRVTLVGHSVGGRATLETVLKYPDKISRLVLVDPALGFNQENVYEQNKPAWYIKTIFNIRPLRNSVLSLTATNPMLTKKMLSGFVHDPEILTPELVSVYQKPFVIKDGTNRLGDWLRYLVIDQDDSLGADWNNLSKINLPTLLIWGDKDTVTPLWQGEHLHEAINRSQLEVISGIGHIPQIEDPQKFNLVLLNFLNKK